MIFIFFYFFGLIYYDTIFSIRYNRGYYENDKKILKLSELS